jgi:GNAT superfamily N-acetyltransferase
MMLSRLRRYLADMRWQLDRVAGGGRRFLIETDLSRLAELAPPSDVDIRAFSGPDWSLLGDMVRKPQTSDAAVAEAADRTCLVAWKRRQAVGYAWFSPEIDCRHERCKLPLPPDAIYIGQIEVARAERRQGVAAALLSAGLRVRRDQGFQRSWIVIDPANVASVHTIASVAPSQVLGTIASLRLLGWIRCRYRVLHAPFPITLYNS